MGFVSDAVIDDIAAHSIVFAEKPPGAVGDPVSHEVDDDLIVTMIVVTKVEGVGAPEVMLVVAELTAASERVDST